MLARLTSLAPRLAAPRLAAMPARALHSSRTPMASTAEVVLGKEYAKMSRKNIHVLDAPTLKSWQEVPVGGLNRASKLSGGWTKDGYEKSVMWKIWYNHAVVPIFVVVGAAGALCGWFMYKYAALPQPPHAALAAAGGASASCPHH